MARKLSIYPPCFALAALGALAMLIDVDSDSVFRYGLALFLLGTFGVLAARTAVSASAVELARQAGYDDGYSDASEAAVPVDNVRHLTLSRPPKQLGEECDVGS